MQPHTYLFTIRLWREEVEDGLYEWRGNVRNSIDGPAQYFIGLHPASHQLEKGRAPNASSLFGAHEQNHTELELSTLGAVIEQMIETLERNTPLSDEQP